MSLVMQAVQQALVNKLNGDAVLMDRVDAIYDTVPQRSNPPYLCVAEIEQVLREQVGREVWEVRVLLEVWTLAQGRKACMAALERLQALLHHGSMSMVGYQLQEMRLIGASCELAERETRVVGSAELQLLLQPS